jgi:hypothetical protein
MPLEKSKTPQMVFFTFDDAVNTYVASFYRKLFDSNRRNPNGCPISMTLFISHANTVYSLVREFYRKGFEIASHSVTHSHPNINTFRHEAEKQKDNLARKARVPKSEIQGWRSPFLKPLGDAQPNILQSLGYSYDATLTISKRKQTDRGPLPFTLDYGWPYDCKINPCPKSAHKGFWEVPVVSVRDYLGKYDCVYVDGCNNPPPDEESAYNFLWENFNSYYKTNKAPFGINMHAAWFYVPDRLNAMNRFIQDLLKLDDVYILPVKQVISWLKTPTPLEELKNFKPWACANPRKRSPKLLAKGFFADTGKRNSNTKAPKRQSKNPRYRNVKFNQRKTPHKWHQSHIRDKSYTVQRSHHIGRSHSKTRPVLHKPLENSYLFQRMQRRKAVRKSHITTATTTTTTPPMPNPLAPKPPKKLLNKSRKSDDLYASPLYSWQSVLTNVVNRESKKLHQQKMPKQKVHQHSHADKRPVPQWSNVYQVVNNTRKDSNTKTITTANKSWSALKFEQITTNRPGTTYTKGEQKSETSTVSTNIGQMGRPVLLTTSSAPQTSDMKVDFQLVGPYTKQVKAQSPALSSLQEWIELQKKQTDANFSSTQSKIVLFKPKGLFEENKNFFTVETTEKNIVEHENGKNNTLDKNDASPERSYVSIPRSKEMICKQGVNCQLPQCFCKTTNYPTNMNITQMPQIVYITIDGDINFLTYSKMKTLFQKSRRNPNGCPIGGTFFTNGRGTSYRLANILYKYGIEIGLNGRQTSAYLSLETLQADINQQSKHFSIYSAIPEENVKGWRSPVLSGEIMENIGVLRNRTMYDSSLVLWEYAGLNKTKPWPFTLDFGIGKCEGENCSSKENKGIWEVPVIPMTSLHDETCAHTDKCRAPKTTEETVEYLMKNFNSYYKTNKAPFGIHLSREWFYWYNNRNFAGLSEFLNTILSYEDVYIVSVSDLLQWMTNPVSLTSAKSFVSWKC